MSLKEQIYSVLIVSSNEKFNHALSPILPESNFYPIKTVTSISAAKQATAERSYDFVFVNTPLPDDMGTRFAIDLCSVQNTVVLLFARSDVYEEIHNKVFPYGVFTLQKPTPKTLLAQALDWMESARERIRNFEKKEISIEEKMAEIRLMNKAKWFLISELKMSEQDAHRYLEKQAMDNCVSKRSIAEEIIKTYS